MTTRQYVIRCPQCGEPAEEFSHPIPYTDDFVDCARCPRCENEWGLDPGADASCRSCGGSGHPGAPPRPDLLAPRCPCGDNAPP